MSEELHNARRYRYHYIGLLALGVAVFMGRIWDGVLLEDPARYASAARCILDTGDWITMHQTPETPYFNKPPLMFWLTAMLFKLSGPGAGAARFWSALAGVGTVLLVYSMGRRLWDESIGFLAALILALTNDFMRYSAAGRLDGPQVFFMALGLWGYVEALTGNSRRWLLLPGVACGLGVLTKGPLVLVILGIIIIHALLEKRFRQLICNRWLILGVLAGIAIALPWHLAVAEANAGFWQHYVGHEMIDRIEGDWKPGPPRYTYLWVLFEHSLPWSLFYIAGLVWGVCRLRSRADGAENKGKVTVSSCEEKCGWKFVFLWLAVASLAAFAPPRMYGRYLMLLYPSLALMAAWPMAYIFPERWRLALGRRLWLVGVGLFVLMAIQPYTRHQRNEKTAILDAAAIVDDTLPDGEEVYLFYTEIHAPLAVTYFYTGREPVMIREEGALVNSRPPLVLSSKAGYWKLKDYGYKPLVQSSKLWLLEDSTGK